MATIPYLQSLYPFYLWCIFCASASPPMDNWDINTIELQVKRSFVKKQQELKDYINDVERLPLSAVLLDPIHVHSIEDFYAAREEEKSFRKIKRIIRKLAFMKKKNVDISKLTLRLSSKSLSAIMRSQKDTSTPEAFLKDNTTGMFPLYEPIKVEYSDPQAIFKRDMEELKHLKKISIDPPHVSRNLSVSSSHTQFIKKMERSEMANPAPNRSSGEITTATAFHNGAFKVLTEDRPKPEETVPESSPVEKAKPMTQAEQRKEEPGSKE